MTKFSIIGHRGYAGAAPENTRAAFEKALNSNKVDAVECDIQLTKDGRLVVIHDFTIDRTSNGTGFVAEYTYNELLAFDFGGWFSPEFAGQKIMLFEDLLKLVDGRKNIMVEIKRTAGLYPDIADKLMEAIRYYPKDRLLIESFDHLLMKQLKEKNPYLCTGILSFDNLALLLDEISFTQSDFFSSFFGNLTSDSVGALLEANVDVCAWTVDTIEELGYLRGLNQSLSICSNYPEKIYDSLYKEC
nr:glycerophosphodiester phosphodiesterase family protein [uncultured Caproiciproducens sp.]